MEAMRCLRRRLSDVVYRQLAGGHKRHVPGPAAQIQHPHVGPDARLGEDHPRRRSQRCALGLEAVQLLFTEAGAELVTIVAVTHRVPPARPVTMIVLIMAVPSRGRGGEAVMAFVFPAGAVSAVSA